MADRRTRPQNGKPRRPSPRPARHDPPAVGPGDRDELRRRLEAWEAEWSHDPAANLDAFKASLWHLPPADVYHAGRWLLEKYVRPWRAAKTSVAWCVVAAWYDVMRERGLGDRASVAHGDAEIGFAFGRDGRSRDED